VKRFFIFLKKNFDDFFKAFLFVLAAAIFVYLFPREGSFRYEFQKGKPWMHEVLIAPFDFPIYKSEREIAKERDSLLLEFRPYYLRDSNQAIQQEGNFRRTYMAEWSQAAKGNNQLKTSRIVAESYLKIPVDILTFIYSKGIADNNEILQQARDADGDIVVVEDNIAEATNSDEVFTQKEAYTFLTQELEKTVTAIDTIRNPNSLLKFFRDLQLNNFINPNLAYDETTSRAAKESLIEGISLTKGMIQAGERIVSKGELVDNENYRIIESLKREYEKQVGGSNRFYMVIVGQGMLVVAVFIVLFLFLLNFRKEILQDRLKTTFILLLVLLIGFVASMSVKYNLISIYVVPFALVPIIIKTFYDARLALFIHIVAILLIGFWAPNSFEFVFLHIMAGIVAIFSLTNLYRRGKLFLTAVLTFITYSILYTGLGIIQEAGLQNIEWKTILWFGGNGLLILTSYPLIYIFEKTFGFLSDATLMELSDTNQPLLRKLAEKAPGTFQHSLQVANLSEEAIFQIGGNPLLVRTGALYHDIGKMDNPLYFIENQTSDINPHDNLEFEESAEVIINHVKRGVEIARKNGLPEQIIDFLRTHHGTSAVQYFYRSYVKKYPEKRADIGKFTYPGPKPFSKETAVLMMADAVEAASRSMKEITLSSLKDLIENIINYQMIEEQFNNANITFKEISTIKEIFTKKLRNVYHARIEYPK